MISDQQILNNEIIQDRIKLLQHYNTALGREELFNIIVQTGVFEELDPSDSNSISLRNYGIRKLEEIGILDESKLKNALISLLNEPASLVNKVRD